MGLDGELLVLTTGLLEQPTRRHVRASREILLDFEATLREAIDREKPGHMLAIPERRAYYTRLVKFDPKYEQNAAAIGLDLAGDYQLIHQRAVAIVKQRYPITQINTIVGPVVLDNSWDQDAGFALDVETIENSRRIGKDIAAGSIVPEPVALFAGCFPEVYAAMGDTMRTLLSDKNERESDWLPPMWLDGAARIFGRVSFDADVTLAGPSAPDLGKSDTTARTGKVKLRPASVQTALQSTLTLPEPRGR